jgi:hypothetical protein
VAFKATGLEIPPKAVEKNFEKSDLLLNRDGKPQRIVCVKISPPSPKEGWREATGW